MSDLNSIGLGVVLDARDLASEPETMHVVLCAAWGGIHQGSPFTGEQTPVEPSPPPGTPHVQCPKQADCYRRADHPGTCLPR